MEDSNGKYINEGLPKVIVRPSNKVETVVHKPDESKANNPITLDTILDAYQAGCRVAPTIANFINGKFDCNPKHLVVKIPVPNTKVQFDRPYDMTERTNQKDIDLINNIIRDNKLGLMNL